MEEAQRGKPAEKLLTLNTIERKNWMIHVLFMRQEYKECLKMLDAILKSTEEKSEFLFFMKGLIYRIEGRIAESLEIFKQCHTLNPNDVSCQKEIGKALYFPSQ